MFEDLLIPRGEIHVIIVQETRKQLRKFSSQFLTAQNTKIVKLQR